MVWQMGTVKPLAIGIGLMLALSGCERQVFLPGERFDVRTPLEQTFTDADGTSPAMRAAAVSRPVPIRLPAARALAEWSQPHANAANNPGHLALSDSPQLLWSVPIGRGNERRNRLTADPVVAGGRVFVMDSQSTVTALSPQGEPLWQVSLVPPGERPESASGGGLSADGGRLFATTGFGNLHALDPATGNVIWTLGLDAPAAAAPTAAGNIVYVVNRRNEAFAVDARQGRIRWQVSSAPVVGFFSGGASPAVAGGSVIFPFGSGEIVSYTAGSGILNWSAGLADGRDGVARASIIDVSSDPVVDGGTLYAANQAGQIVALDRGTGELRWTAREGAYSPVVPIGGSVFAVTDRLELVRLDARTGARLWLTELPGYRSDRVRRLRDVHAHYGPVLAGGRLLVASSDGFLRFFDPVSGAESGRLEIRGGAASHPVVVGGTLYVLSGDGRLNAFR